MLRSYFFIPASRPRFIQKINSLNADNFVFDLEDAIAENDIETAIVNLKQVPDVTPYWIRPRLFKNNQEINNKQLETLFEMGFRRFFLPKLETPEQISDLNNIFDYYDIKDFEWILLIESPLALINIKTMLESGEYPVKGIALGAQDYASKTQMQFSEQRIQWARTKLLNVAYALNVEPIDYASMIISDMNHFANDTLEGFRMGYQAKIIIHPNQLKTLQALEYYSIDEIDQAKRLSHIIDLSKAEKMHAIVVEGKTYERPHLERIKRILDYAEKRNLL